MRLIRFERVFPEIEEHLSPEAIPDVMMARGHQGHLEPAMLAVASMLRLNCGRVCLLERAGVAIPGGVCPRAVPK